VFPSERPPNQVLVNSYSPGSGIAPHKDGAERFHATPGAAILSLASPVLIKFYKEPESSAAKGPGSLLASVLLEPRSLLCFSGESFVSVLHGIDATQSEVVGGDCVNAPPDQVGSVIERRTRLSLTCRAAKTSERAALQAELPTSSIREEIVRRRRQWLGSIADSAALHLDSTTGEGEDNAASERCEASKRSEGGAAASEGGAAASEGSAAASEGSAVAREGSIAGGRWHRTERDLSETQPAKGKEDGASGVYS